MTDTTTKRVTATMYAITLPDGIVLNKRSFRWHQAEAVASVMRNADGSYLAMVWPDEHRIGWPGSLGILKATRIGTE